MSDYPYNAGNMTMTIPIAKFAELHDKIKSRDTENARLKAEVERLTKAGDAMADYLFDAPYPCRIFYHKWKDAKEGKGQS